MSEDTNGLTRRDFIRGTAGAAIAGAVGISAWPAGAAGETAPQGGNPTVVLIRDEKVVGGDGSIDAKALETMLDRAVAELTGAEDAAAAWKTLVKADDTVGIKSNVWRFLPTPPALEEALRQRVIAAGVSKEHVAVDDRGVLHDPIFERATALVNVRPMRTHHWAGVGSLLKNYIMFTDVPSAWHDDACANLGGIWMLPRVAGRTRLNVLVMLTPLFHSVGPHDYSAKHTWQYRGLLVGTDPVAVDATGLRILEAKRRLYFGTDEPFPVPPKHIRVAAEKFHLGVADPSRITVRKLGWPEGVLI